MMSNSTTGTTTQTKPKQLALLFHLRKTVSLIGAVLSDSRVHWIRKTLFLGTIAALIVALIGGDAVNDLLDGVIVPIFGNVLGLPIDGTFDWIALSVAAYNLLKLFPAEVVGEHYDRLFRSGKSTSGKVA
jgi:hypothetical protein